MQMQPRMSAVSRRVAGPAQDGRARALASHHVSVSQKHKENAALAKQARKRMRAVCTQSASRAAAHQAAAVRKLCFCQGGWKR